MRPTIALIVLFGPLVGTIYSQTVADGFDYPVGRPDGAGYYNAQDFGISRHLGEDWNGVAGGNSDLGAPVYSVAHGIISYAANAGPGWGNVVIVRHQLPNGTEVASMYAHLEVISRTTGSVRRGDQIGTIGRGYDYGGGRFDYQEAAHLHFELRTNVSLGVGPGYSANAAGWTDPSDFIDAHRNLMLGPDPGPSQPVLRIDGSTSSTRAIGETFAFTGNAFTVGGTVSRYVREPGGAETTLTPTLNADGGGNIAWSFTPTCTTPTGTYTVWARDDATGRTSNTVAETVISHPSCDAPAPPPPPPPTSCSYDLSPTTQAVSASGSSFTATLTRTSGDCGWSASTNAPWITLTGPTSGSGNATPGYDVGANSSSSGRSGTITVSWTGGLAQLSVTQAGAQAPPSPSVLGTYSFANDIILPVTEFNVVPAGGCPEGVIFDGGSKFLAACDVAFPRNRVFTMSDIGHTSYLEPSAEPLFGQLAGLLTNGDNRDVLFVWVNPENDNFGANIATGLDFPGRTISRIGVRIDDIRVTSTPGAEGHISATLIVEGY